MHQFFSLEPIELTVNELIPGQKCECFKFARMRVILVLFILGCYTAVHSQFITHDKGRYGLMDSSGKAILPNAFDTVYKVPILYYKTPVFYYSNGNRFGFYNGSDRSLTPMEFNELKRERDGAIFYRKDSLWGFVGETPERTCKIFPPRYKKLYLISRGDNPFSGESREEVIKSNMVVAFNGSYYGALNYSTSDTVVDFKYKSPIEKSLDGIRYIRQKDGTDYSVVFFSKDGAREIIIPVEFPSIKFDRIFLNDTFYLTFLYYRKDGRSFQLNNYLTGEKVFEYRSTTFDLKNTFLTSDLLVLSEEFENKKSSTYIHKVYEIKSGKLLTEYTAKNGMEYLYYSNDEGRRIIYVRSDNSSKWKALIELEP